MIYKFLDFFYDDSDFVLEVSRDGILVRVTVTDTDNNDSFETFLDADQLYKLIGALHEIQKDIRKEEEND